METLPVLSLAKLKDINRSGVDNLSVGNSEHQRLYDICLNHGFFYLKDHGISRDLVQATINASRNFFSLPESIKNEYGHHAQSVHPQGSRGYVPIYGETLNEDDGPDPKELFDLGVNRPSSDIPFTGPTLMPDDSVAPEFTEFHYKLQSAILTKIVPPLLKALAVALKLDANWFAPFFDDPIVIHRTILYPPQHGVTGKHTDNGIFTVLIQEYFPTPSLRVYKGEDYVDAVCLDNTFVINLGNMLQLWTNGLFVSTPHEVVHTLPSSRVSMPFFIFPSANTIIEPMGTDTKINATDMMLKNFEAIWSNGKGTQRAEDLA